MKIEVVRARIDEQLKLDAEKILDTLGLSSSVAINMLFRQIVLLKGLPFAVELPNAKTRRAILDARNGDNQVSVATKEELFRALRDDE
jgi:DNA-damage-inducible protein J